MADQQVEDVIPLRSQMRAWWPVFAYATLILVASSIPSSALPDDRLLREDKLVHFVEYALLGGLLLRGFHLGWPPLRGAQAVLVAAAIAAGFGLIDEWYQSLTPGRDSSLWDLAADTLGGLCGSALALVRYRKRIPHDVGSNDRKEHHGHGQKVPRQNSADW